MDRLTTRHKHRITVEGCATVFSELRKSPMTAAINRLADYEDIGLTPEEITAAADRRHECRIDCLLEEYNKQSAQLAEMDKEITRLKAERDNMAGWVDCLLEMEILGDPDLINGAVKALQNIGWPGPMGEV